MDTEMYRKKRRIKMTLRKNKRRKNNDTFHDFLDIILKEPAEEDGDNKNNNIKGNKRSRPPKATLEKHKKNGNCDEPETKVKVKVKKVDRIQFKTKDNKKMFMCKKCPMMFETIKELKIHRKEHASKEFVEDHTYSFDKAQEIYICNTCSAEFKDKDEAEKHTRMHKEIFECSLCEDKFQTLFQLGSHLKVTHNADQQFSCPLCPEMKFPKPSLFMKHIDTKHQKRYMYNCRECGKCFHSKTLCRDHMNVHLGIKPFACIVCDARFTYSKSVVTHQLKAHRVEILGKSHSTECSFCRNRFVSIASLERHVQQVHSTPKAPKEKIHLCDICGMGFAKKNKMVVHQRVHTGVKPYSCRFCDKNFSKSGERNCHERIHTGERPYSCEYCGKAFRQSAPFKVHIRTHTGERPYVCEFCSKGFTTNQGLKLHKKKNCASMDFKGY